MCIFCQIVAGEIPFRKVYEDEKTLAFLDIKPVSPGHTLIIPKGHYSSLEEIPEEELAAVILSAKKVGMLLKDKLKIAGYNLNLNNGPVAGQDIYHLHFHAIPRQESDGLKLWSQREYADGEADGIIKKLLKL